MTTPFGNLLRRLTTGAAIAIVAGSLVATPASADSTVPVKNGSITVKGTGYGHGWGMSQWGAYGAAKKGLSYRKILGFYYPGTTLTTTKTTHMRVWLSVDNDGDLRVKPSSGLRVYNVGTSASYTLPTGSTYRQWRMVRSGSHNLLQYLNSGGSWKTKSAKGISTAKAWRFDNKANVLKVVLPGGAVGEFRGQVGLVLGSTSTKVVNRLPLDQYVQAVVPAEMPTSWHLEGVKAQSVAARTYALRSAQYQPSSSGYEVCDTVSCQVYRGVTQTSASGSRRAYEDSRGNSATTATAGKILTYQGGIALTQFSASNGGAIARGSQPYQQAKSDPYDGVMKDQRWSKQVSTSTLTKAFGGIGTVTKIRVSARDGNGAYGGRATSVKIYGTRGTKTVSGTSFRSALALRSHLVYLRS